MSFISIYPILPMPDQSGALFSARKRTKFFFRRRHVGGMRFLFSSVRTKTQHSTVRAYLGNKTTFM